MARQRCEMCRLLYARYGDRPLATGRDGRCTPCRTLWRSAVKRWACVNADCNCGPIGGGTLGWRPKPAWGGNAARWRARTKNRSQKLRGRW